MGAVSKQAKEHKKKYDGGWERLNPDKVRAKRDRYYSTWKGRFHAWRGNAKLRKVEWTLTQEYLESIPLVCHYTGRPLTLEKNKVNTVSIDRLDSSLGYIEDNIVYCCGQINIMKMDKDVKYFVDLCREISDHFKE